jgi:hypothetical protein
MPKFQIAYTIKLAREGGGGPIATVSGIDTFMATSDAQRATVLKQCLENAISALKRQLPSLEKYTASYSMLTVMPSLD